MTGQLYCGLCIGYTDHDTIHHATNGEFAPGDQVKILYEGLDRVARVEDLRGRRARVAFSLSRGRTHTIWVDREVMRPVP